MNLSGIQSHAESLFQIGFDFYKRNITVFSPPTRIISGTSAGFNFSYPNEETPDEIVTFIPVSGVIEATVKFSANVVDRDASFAMNEARYRDDKGVVRITVQSSGLAIVRDSESVEFDNQTYWVVGGPRPRGMFSTTQYDFWLQTTE